MNEAALAEMTAAANALAEETDSDILLFNSQFQADTDGLVLKLILGRKRRKNVTLILVSEGGIADAAYKIARCLQKSYTSYTAFVHGYCKSAGTLCLLGAHGVVMSVAAELGPLDVQVAKRDELGQRSSGLVAGEALAALKDRAFEMYEEFFLQILQRSEQAVTFRTASDIASQIVVGLFEPLYAQINPVEVGEMARSMRIANDYGQRLGVHSGNLTTSALELLCQTYPSHGFVIDDAEAASLFKNIRCPTDSELHLALLEGLAQIPMRKPFIAFLNDSITTRQDAHHEPPAEPDAAIAAHSSCAREGGELDATSAEGAVGTEQAGEHPAATAGGPHTEKAT